MFTEFMLEEGIAGSCDYDYVVVVEGKFCFIPFASNSNDTDHMKRVQFSF